MAYEYSNKQLEPWEEPARSTALLERSQHLERQANYWKQRAESAERRMLEHDCTEEGK
ncbi:hypothetical protein [Glutamicibacter ardleyensis]|uniref:hypothetical protein n=1 Tax=Glutamicibacter ardleyensis TaxID=225894 RepID=UPI003FD00350